jgi:N-acetyl-gamma-glutamyl-phosphate reductase
MRAAVIGAGGYAGGELLRLLLTHPQVTSTLAVSRSQAGKPVGDVHPAVAPLTDARFADLAPEAAAAEADVVFLALEHGESSKVAGAVLAAGPRLVVDLAADFRIHDQALHERFYGVRSAPDVARCFVYGLADIEGERLRSARAIAAPGCFATAALLALYPLAALGPDVEPALFAVTGSSGAGAQPKPTTHHPVRAQNLFAYSVLGHRHEGEVLSAWRKWTGNPSAHARLLTHSGPFVRGIYLTAHARVRGGGSGGVSVIAAAVNAAYAGRPFVKVRSSPPELTHVVGTNYAHLHAAVSDDATEVVITVAIDNLVKGAAGQAVQAMNLALGIPEETGLRSGGVFPC